MIINRRAITNDERSKLIGLEEALVIEDQRSPSNLANITVDGYYSIRNDPADLATFGITGHVRGDILQRTSSPVAWKFITRPIGGETAVLNKSTFSDLF